jgi:hypothetical protein
VIPGIGAGLAPPLYPFPWAALAQSLLNSLDGPPRLMLGPKLSRVIIFANGLLSEGSDFFVLASSEVGRLIVGASIASKGIFGEDNFKFRREEEPEHQGRTAGIRQAKKRRYYSDR